MTDAGFSIENKMCLFSLCLFCGGSLSSRSFLDGSLCLCLLLSGSLCGSSSLGLRS